MNHSKRPAPNACTGLALTTQEREWDRRADEVIAKLYEAKAVAQRLAAEQARLRAEYQQLQVEYTRLRDECTHLRLVVRAKQEVIALLLPYYPHPLTPAMQANINIMVS